MTLVELVAMLRSTGYEVAYSHFNDPPALPYITYLVAFSSNFIADNQVYHKIDNVQIELYTDKKDLEAESKLEAALDENKLPYDNTETWISSEKLYQKIYEVRLI